METAQRFSLGSLYSEQEQVFPDEVELRLHGRGIFLSVSLELTFPSSDNSGPRLLVMDRPWNAVLQSVELNGEELPSEAVGEIQRSELPPGLKTQAESALHDGETDFVCLLLEPGRSLRTVRFEFVLACQILWHQSGVSFKSHRSTTVRVDATWDLSGLPGARVDCTDEAQESRFSNLDASKLKWTEELVLRRGEKIGLLLRLDEKKAASLCLYSPPNKSAEGPGCGAVVVVAPVRPQLVRQPVKIAVVAEIQNPQEGLLTRELVASLSSRLNADDELSIQLMSSTRNVQVADWTPAHNLGDDLLGKLIEPEFMGRTDAFWSTFQEVLVDCQGATHILLATPGPAEQPPENLPCPLPVFCFDSSNRPGSAPLEGLALNTGGFVSLPGPDRTNNFLERLDIRLSPPLLRDFRLEGWGLEDVFPAGPTQVYTDKPTLVLGLYEGLLPQTVTIGGFSPAGQKLAQRVRVESFNQFDLMPLFENRARSRGEDPGGARFWQSGGTILLEGTRPLPVDVLFHEPSEPEQPHPSDQLVAPPTMDTQAPAVEFDDDFFSAQGETIGDDFFSTAKDSEEDPPSFLEESVEEESEELPLRVSTGETLGVSGFDPFSQEDPGEEVPDELIFGSPTTDVPDETIADSFDVFETRDTPFTEPDVIPDPGTMTVTMALPGWVKKLTELGTDEATDWLARCPIDTLALALVDTDEVLSVTFLERLEERRKEAVTLQMELGKLLPPQERKEAGRYLESLL